uniref:Uncharacterized protein TCIL3000_10_11150 n=1 Tax=Trypanosoma congolense (strain IL3000) TaxID=1068625 RepID=G0UY69_TRYCI|nr:unnamed protein product [Trypanosoma congolense IL3000]
MYTGEICSPYEILGVPQFASVADIRSAFKRLALITHPDKQVSYAPHTTPRAVSRCIHPFHMVKEACELLLDPLRRARYDEQKNQMYVRSAGAVGEIYDIQDFQLVDEKTVPRTEGNEGDGVTVRIFELECRCGGLFQIFLTGGGGGSCDIDLLCECDSCSLIVAVKGKMSQ